MVFSKESVRLYSYKHFSSTLPLSFSSCFTSPQPSKLAFMLSTSNLMLVLTFRSRTVKKVKTAARIAANRSREPGGNIEVFDMVVVKLDSSENIDMKISLVEVNQAIK